MKQILFIFLFVLCYSANLFSQKHKLQHIPLVVSAIFLPKTFIPVLKLEQVLTGKQKQNMIGFKPLSLAIRIKGLFSTQFRCTPNLDTGTNYSKRLV